MRPRASVPNWRGSNRARCGDNLDGPGVAAEVCCPGGDGAGRRRLFDYSDWLGTARMRATISGYEQEFPQEIPPGVPVCTSLPYGAGLDCTGGTDYSPMHFTGQVRDASTGLDHFPARYYTSAWGQFTTPDDGSAQSVADVQSWDLYGYARDNPATLTDPSGRDVRVCVTTGRADAKQQTCTVMSDEQYHELYEAQNGKQEIQMPGASPIPPPAAGRGVPLARWPGWGPLFVPEPERSGSARPRGARPAREAEPYSTRPDSSPGAAFAAGPQLLADADDAHQVGVAGNAEGNAGDNA